MSEFNEKIIAERRNECLQIEDDVQMLYEINNNLAAMLNSQGTQLDDVEYHVENSVENVAQSRQNLSKAAQKSNNMLYIAGAGIIGGVTLLSTLGYIITKK